ncbi:MAG TPA: chemotaxis protein CheC [Myxococcota bacterium]|jgi:chemotaxis protein CheY-P-specific phosphatase CheC
MAIARNLVEAGAAEAARAIALLLRKPTVPVRAIDVVDAEGLALRLAPRALVVGFTVSGGVPGRFALAATEAHGNKLAQDLVGVSTRSAVDGLNKRALGALTELGNIGASAYLNGLARALDTACVPSVPSLLVDDALVAVQHALGNAREISVATLEAGSFTIELCLTR